jgi:hypothetical protein
MDQQIPPEAFAHITKPGDILRQKAVIVMEITLFCPEDGSNRFLQNVGTFLLQFTTLHTTGHRS